MPWWLALYLVVFVTITVLWVREDVRDKEPLPIIVVELVATGLLVVSGMAYWFHSVRTLLGANAPWIFVGSLSWILVTGYQEWRKIPPDPELSRMEDQATRLGGLALLLAVYSPLLVWGSLWAFRGAHNGP